jgi:alpha-tubulin suppressor-like RCC1 family protein
MLKKIIVLCAVVCLGIISLSPLTVAGINEGTFTETATSFSMDWGWDIEEAGTWNYTGTYWYVSLSIADGGANWDVTWEVEHFGPPGTRAAHPSDYTYSQSTSFDKSTTGQVANEPGLHSHPSRACDNCHNMHDPDNIFIDPSEWTWDNDQLLFNFDRSGTPSDTVISFTGTYQPAYITFSFSGTVTEVSDSALFGGAVVGNTISGSYTFDSTTPPTDYGAYWYEFPDLPSTQLNVQVGTLSLTQPFKIGVYDDAVVGLVQDLYAVNSGDAVSMEEIRVNMEVEGQPPGYITTLDLPLTPPAVTGPQIIRANINLNLNDFINSRFGYLTASWDTLYMGVPSVYTLTVTNTGSGTGTVTSGPAGIDCGSDCSEDYIDGTRVTLTATPDAGSAFIGWSGDADCSDADGVVSMNSAKTCTAAFELVYHTLTVTKTGSGTVTSSPAGIDCGSDCSEDYVESTAVTLTATPDAGSIFTGWSGDADCNDDMVTMDSAKTCTATFQTAVTPQIQKGFNVILKSDGTIWASGRNRDGQLGYPTTEICAWDNAPCSTYPQQVGTDDDWVAVSQGGHHTLAIKSDGTLWAWGNNSEGQLGYVTTETWYDPGPGIDVPYSSTPGQVGTDDDWVAVTGGHLFTIALKSNGTLWGWGSNASYQLTSSPVGGQIGTDTDWVDIAAGWQHTVALKSDGKLYAWGANVYGQLGYATTELCGGFMDCSGTPEQVETEETWVAIETGYYHTMALKSDGTLWTWGANVRGQLGHPAVDSCSWGVCSASPEQVGTDTTWISIFAGNEHSIARKAGGTIWAWGWNVYGQLGDGTTIERTSPVQTGTDTDWVVSIVSAGSHTTALKSDGTFWVWGSNGYGQLGDGTADDISSPIQTGTIDIEGASVSVAAGVNHNLSIQSDGTLWAWGENTYGQIGDGTFFDALTQIQVVIDSVQYPAARNNDWITVAAGLGHSLALKTDGTLWAWGLNDRGQLGDGTTADAVSPVRISTDTDWVLVAAGGRHNLALKSNGTLWAWGSNVHGQLGNGTLVDELSPVQIGLDTDWVAIAAGGELSHSLARKSNGKLYAWGRNNRGQLGDGTTVDKSSPVQVGTDNKWVKFKAGLEHSVGRKSNGKLFAWGRNDYGQLGDGTTTDKTSPVPIGTDTDWKEIASGWHHNLAKKSNGKVYAWGRNNYGQLGDGSTDDKTSPVPIGTDKKWRKIKAGGWHSTGRKSDGSVWGWGRNNHGQCGDGSLTDRPFPGIITWVCKLAPSIKIPGHFPFYWWTGLQDAYNNAYDGETILSKSTTFIEDLNINISKSINMRGGYRCFYIFEPTGKTEVQGDLWISSGTLNLGNFIIKK